MILVILPDTTFSLLNNSVAKTANRVIDNAKFNYEGVSGECRFELSIYYHLFKN